MTTFIQQLYNGVALGSVYVLVALGITLIYGLTRLVNFAHGQMLTLGAFISFALVQLRVPVPFAVLASMVAVGVTGEILDLVLFRRTLHRPLSGLIISLGLIAALESLFVLFWSTNSYQVPTSFHRIWEVGGIRIDELRAIELGVTLLACGLLFLALERTDLGRALRALAEDGLAARALGVPVSMLISATFFVGSAMAALAGALLGAIFVFDAYSGSAFLLKGFAVAIIGGLGNVRGAVVAALILGIAETLGGGYISIEWSAAFGLSAMVLILALRPQGLFRGTEGDSEEAFGSGWAVPKTETPRTGWRARFGDHAAPAIAVAVAALFVLLLPTVIPNARELSVATSALVLGVVAFALWLTMHYAGMLSVVQGALMGVGAYTAGLMAHRLCLGFWVELPVAALMGTILAIVMGVLSLRGTATGFVILTFALSQLLVTIFTNWTSLTGGAIGMVLGSDPGQVGPIDFGDSLAFYYLAALALIMVMAVSFAIRLTGFGRRLTTIRDNERLARSLGLNTTAHKLAIFAVGGAVAALGGQLTLYQFQFVEPTLFDVFTAINVQLVVIIGGVASPIGPVVGALIVAFLPEVLHLDPNASRLAYGVLLVLMATLLPQGMTGAGTDLFRRLRSGLRL